jgi:hypothetical protein
MATARTRHRDELLDCPLCRPAGARRADAASVSRRRCRRSTGASRLCCSSSGRMRQLPTTSGRSSGRASAVCCGPTWCRTAFCRSRCAACCSPASLSAVRPCDRLRVHRKALERGLADADVVASRSSSTRPAAWWRATSTWSTASSLARGKKPSARSSPSPRYSAAYSIASACGDDRGAAHRQVGSIGVVLMHVDVSRLARGRRHQGDLHLRRQAQGRGQCLRAAARRR